MKTKEGFVFALVGYAGGALGVRLGKSIVKKFFQWDLEKEGRLFMNKTTHELVVVVDVVSGGLFKSPSVIYEVKEKKFEISLDSFIESFHHCRCVMAKEGD